MRSTRAEVLRWPAAETLVFRVRPPRVEAALFRCVACPDTAGQVAFGTGEGSESGFPHEVWAPSTQLALAVETRLAELTGSFSSRTSLPSILCVTLYS